MSAVPASAVPIETNVCNLLDWQAPDYGPIWQDRLAKLKALRSNPERIPGLKAYYATHPVDFINDWGTTFDPRNAGTKVPVTMPFILFPKQREYIEWLYARWQKREDAVVEKSRDMGLSWLCCAFSTWLWLFHAGSVVGFGSRKEDLVDKSDDPNSLFWKLRMFIRLLPVEFQPAGYQENKHAAHMRISNPEARMQGAAIVGEAGDNIGRGARTTLYFKDESAHWEHPESCDAALSQTSNCKIDISTPNGEGNPFWQKVFGGVFPVFTFDWRDDPRKGKAWYAKQKKDLTAVALAQEVDRDYSASVSNSFIPSGTVTVAMARGPADVRPMGGLRVGLDVARFGDDKCVLTFRRGRAVLKQVAWAKVNIESTAGRARAEIEAFRERPEQIAVDVIGVGAGAADLLRGYYMRPDDDIVVDVNSAIRLGNGKHYNLRAFMWDQMKEWLDYASLLNMQQLRIDLTGLRYEYKGGELLIESKDDAKKRGLKSPDYGDSLALTFAYPVTPKSAPIRASQIVDYTPHNEMGL